MFPFRNVLAYLLCRCCATEREEAAGRLAVHQHEQDGRVDALLRHAGAWRAYAPACTATALLDAAPTELSPDYVHCGREPSAPSPAKSAATASSKSPASRDQSSQVYSF